MKKKILLLSGYDAASHRYWRKTLSEMLPGFNWTQLALPDRNFSWRMRGNALTFVSQYEKELNESYDLLIATSMVDLASLIGFVPQLGKIPKLVYFHENQFAYPLSKDSTGVNNEANSVSAQLTSIYSVMVADKILFNSQYNRETFFRGAQALLKRLPDKFPTESLEALNKRSRILAVPIFAEPHKTNKVSTETATNQKNKLPHIVWNHRWEYDKQPGVFFDALKLLKNSGQKFKLHVLGQAFRKVPDCFEEAKTYFSEEIITFGFQSKQNYQKILNSSDIVVSSALHDFQGLGLMEAIIAGCNPIAPNRVAYPEYVLKSNLYDISEPKNEAEELYVKLKDQLSSKLSPVHDLTSYRSDILIPEYLQVIESLINNNY